MQRGYIKIWRKTVDSGLIQMPNTLALFMAMLLRAAYRPCKLGTLDLERGQVSAGRFQLCEWTGLSEQNVRTSLKHLHDMKIITSKPTNKFTVYTFVNYGQYQDSDDVSNQQINQQLTNNQPTTNQQLTTIKEDKHLSIKEVKNKTSAAFALPDWIDKKMWDLWMQTRKGKKMIPAQMQAQVDKLSKWKDSGIDYAGALAASAENGWAGLFEPKAQRGGVVSRQSENDRVREAARKLIFGQNEEKTIESI